MKTIITIITATLLSVSANAQISVLGGLNSGKSIQAGLLYTQETKGDFKPFIGAGYGHRLDNDMYKLKKSGFNPLKTGVYGSVTTHNINIYTGVKYKSFYFGTELGKTYTKTAVFYNDSYFLQGKKNDNYIGVIAGLDISNKVSLMYTYSKPHGFGALFQYKFNNK